VVGYDKAGPALDIADQLARRLPAGVELAGTTTTDYTAACAGFLAAVVEHRLTHRGRPALDEAVAAAVQRLLGDRWAWSRRDSASSIAGLVAATVALWWLDHQPAPPVAPVIVTRKRDAAEADAPPAGPRPRRTLVH
jgi:hypothetical protein